MHTHAFPFVATCLLLSVCLPASAQNSPKQQASNRPAVGEQKEPVAILEIGAATSWNVKGGATTFAPSLAGEVTPVKNWHELEAGVTPFYTAKSTEWDTDLLFKKPWKISRKSEFMLGVGPEWDHLRKAGTSSNSIAGELAADLMFWPNGKHRFGWYLEPAYQYSFSGGHEQSIGISGGLLIGIR